MKTILKIILKLLAKAAVRKYKPVIVGITGSVGKTSVKEAIFKVLKNRYNVRRSNENFNNEIGFPMTILGLTKQGRFIWISNIIKALKILIVRDKNYPEMLVLEMAADRPKDIRYLINIAKPKVGVVTAIGEVPVHVEFYSGPEAVAEEKSNLIKALPSDGLAVLNFDDHVVYEMSELSNSRVLTFGFGQGADVRASDLNYFAELKSSSFFLLQGEPRASVRNSGEEKGGDLGGLSFKINYADKVIPFRLNNALGRHQVYAALAACCVGLYFGVNLVEIAQALENVEFPKHRMKLLTGIKNTLIIDDTYNASPLSTHAALDTLKEFGDKAITKRGIGRKVAILGNMSELGKYTMNAHRNIGNLAAEKSDLLITIGAKAKFIADSAQNQMPLDKIISFDNPDELLAEIHNKIEEGDIILIKGSRIMELEKIVYAVVKV